VGARRQAEPSPLALVPGCPQYAVGGWFASPDIAPNMRLEVALKWRLLSMRIGTVRA
jgi:hypothetical protein